MESSFTLKPLSHAVTGESSGYSSGSGWSSGYSSGSGWSSGYSSASGWSSGYSSTSGLSAAYSGLLQDTTSKTVVLEIKKGRML